MQRLPVSLALALVTALLVSIVSSCSKTETAAVAIEEPTAEALPNNAFARLKATLCGKQVALLGEGPNHGEGTTDAFKAKLAQSLIEDCGFSLILFESSLYEAIKVNRDVSQGHTVKTQDIEAVISFLWRDGLEMKPLIGFIRDSVNNGSLKIGGLDDRIGSRGQDYANFVMPIEITEGLSEPLKTGCRDAINKRLLYSYTKENPYDLNKKEYILSCLKTLEESQPQLNPNGPEIFKIRSLYRGFSRDLSDRKVRLTGREASMYESFEYWYNRSPDAPRIIIWGATVHLAKNSEVMNFFENEPHFGETIKTKFGDEAYAVGFSAFEGSHKIMGGDVEPLAVALENSIEALTFEATNDDVVFLSTADLKRFGLAPAAAVNNSYQTRNWASVLDGMVIFREQKPPTKIDEKSLR